eukprot:1178107-Prorocentrum_minimum.AAC.2
MYWRLRRSRCCHSMVQSEHLERAITDSLTTCYPHPVRAPRLRCCVIANQHINHTKRLVSRNTTACPSVVERVASSATLFIFRSTVPLRKPTKPEGKLQTALIVEFRVFRECEYSLYARFRAPRHHAQPDHGGLVVTCQSDLIYPGSTAGPSTFVVSETY